MLILIIIIYTIIFNRLYKEEDKVDIIISRYNEDLCWTLEHPYNKYKYIVYNKGINEDFEKENVIEIINLPNLGREGHTYFYHILNHELADVNIFVPGSVNMVRKRKVLDLLISLLIINNKASFVTCQTTNLREHLKNFQLDHYGCTFDINAKINPSKLLYKSAYRPFSEWYDHKFGRFKCVNGPLAFGLFSIHKLDILQHPKEYYQQFLEELEEHSNPEVGHYVERAWGAIFKNFNHSKLVKLE